MAVVARNDDGGLLPDTGVAKGMEYGTDHAVDHMDSVPHFGGIRAMRVLGVVGAKEVDSCKAGFMALDDVAGQFAYGLIELVIAMAEVLGLKRTACRFELGQ